MTTLSDSLATATPPLLATSPDARLLLLPQAFVLETATAHAMQRWLQQRCRFEPGQRTAFAVLQADWLHWADMQGEFASTARRLGMALRFLGLRPCVMASGTVRAWQGITLLNGGAQ